MDINEIGDEIESQLFHCRTGVELLNLSQFRNSHMKKKQHFKCITAKIPKPLASDP